MPPEPDDSWQLENFLEVLDRWIELENPPSNLRRRVTAWLLAQWETPYAGVVRQEGFADLWYGVIPGTWHNGRVVACSYWIDPQRMRIRCDSIATLSSPA
jgi:hypothetical protein